MARAKSNKLYRTFTKGLITEAGYLTYPEDASVDELNTVINRKGNRTRRLGVNYEDSKVLNSLGTTATTAINEFVWKSANNDATSNFFCLQVGTTIRFFSMEAEPISDSLKSFSVDLMAYAVPGTSQATVETNVAQFAAGNGYLFICHSYVEPLLIEYKKLDDAITTTRIFVQVRDLVGVYDGLANEQEPTGLTKEHLYNLLNQGWGPPGSTPPVVSGTDTAPVTSSTPGASVYYDPYSGSARYYKGNGFYNTTSYEAP